MFSSYADILEFRKSTRTGLELWISIRTNKKEKIQAVWTPFLILLSINMMDFQESPLYCCTQISIVSKSSE